MRLAWLWAFVSLACGSLEPPAFRCKVDEQCTLAEATGICTAEGYCAFEDETCQSGFRYAEHVAEELASACVERGDPAPAK